MSAWTADELARIGKATELQITLRRTVSDGVAIPATQPITRGVPEKAAR
jgi:hypothetical protein